MPSLRLNAASWADSEWVKERQAFLKRSLLPLALIAAVGLGVSAYVVKHVRIGWDPQGQSCLPWSFYLYSPVDNVDAPYRGQLVRVRLPKSGPGTLPKGFEEAFAKGLPGGGAKIVVGMPGDRVRIKNNWLVVNEDAWGFLWLMTTLSLPDKALDKEYRIPAGHYLVLGTQPESYDGRYWGVVPQKDILGSIRVIL